jgi:hypothetical protein
MHWVGSVETAVGDYKAQALNYPGGVAATNPTDNPADSANEEPALTVNDATSAPARPGRAGGSVHVTVFLA